MGLKKGTPGKGGQGKVDSFSYTPVPFGFKNWFTGWLAGDPYWGLAHEHTDAEPGTKPCLLWLTDNALRCPRCRPQKPATWIGWVPIYREADGQPIMVVVHESASDLLTGLKYPDYVTCGRVGEKSSVFVKKSDKRLSFLTSNEQRKRSRDITGDLLNMWKYPQLEQWLLDQRRGEPTVPLKSDGERFGPMTAAAAEKYGGSNDRAKTAEAEYDAIQNRVKEHMQNVEAQKNGKHKPE